LIFDPEDRRVNDLVKLVVEPASNRVELIAETFVFITIRQVLLSVVLAARHPCRWKTLDQALSVCLRDSQAIAAYGS
jgi:hypothetical protein